MQRVSHDTVGHWLDEDAAEMGRGAHGCHPVGFVVKEEHGIVVEARLSGAIEVEVCHLHDPNYIRNGFFYSGNETDIVVLCLCHADDLHQSAVVASVSKHGFFDHALCNRKQF